MISPVGLGLCPDDQDDVEVAVVEVVESVVVVDGSVVDELGSVELVLDGVVVSVVEDESVVVSVVDDGSTEVVLWSAAVVVVVGAGGAAVAYRGSMSSADQQLRLANQGRVPSLCRVRSAASSCWAGVARRASATPVRAAWPYQSQLLSRNW